jgi:hypothetical protein
MNPGDCPNDSVLELSERFSARYCAPVLRAFDLEEGRITFGHLLAEDSPFPLPQVDLSEIGFDDRRLTDVVKERRSSLHGALERRDVNRSKGDMAKPLTDLCCLPLPMGG